MNDINRRLHEALGKCWHEQGQRRIDGEFYKQVLRSVCTKCDFIGLPDNPDYCADPRLVIDAMRERENFIKFVYWIGGSMRNAVAYISLDLIIYTTGKLALMAIEFLGKEANDGQG